MQVWPSGSRSMPARAWGWLALCALLNMAQAGPAAAVEQPLLQLETGGPMAIVRSLVFTADGRQLVSASDDKVIRVWDVAAGRTVRTLRGQQAEGEAGKIYALAFSPDGRWLAAGGRMAAAGKGGHPIRLYDFASGRIVALLEGHRDAVLSLDFSPDGKRLVSAGTDDVAIIWDLRTRRAGHVLKGHAGDVNAARFAADGARVVTAGDDHTVRLWRVRDGRLVSVLKAHADKVIALAVSPRDGRIASGGLDRTIRLWDGRTGRALGRLADQGTEVMSLTFAPDGATLVSGVGSAPHHAHVWDTASGRRLASYKGHDNIVLATAVSPDGGVGVTAGGNDNEIHLWDLHTGAPSKRLGGVGGAVWAVGFAEDGRRIGWGGTRRFKTFADQGPLEFALRLPEAARPTGAPRPIGAAAGRFTRAVVDGHGIRLRHRAGGDFGYYANLDVLRNGKTVAVIGRDENDGYAHNAYTLTPDGRTVISGGGHGWLSAYDLKGRKLGDFVGHTSDVWAVAVSPDGRLLLSGSDDQTVRLWNVETRENIVTLFHGRNGEWVMWTPQGYYAASPSGDKHVGWHINQGADTAGRFVSAAQLKRHFYRPDIIKRAILSRSARAAVGAARGTDFALGELLRRQPPAFAFVSPQTGATTSASPAAVTFRLAANRDPAERLDVTVNGRRVISRAVRREEAAGDVTLEVPLSAGRNRIRVAVHNAVGRTDKELVLNHTGAKDLDRRGTLYVLSIGVDAYPNFKGQDLEFAGADARALHRMLIEKAGPLHASVKSLLLAKDGSGAPNAKNIRDALKLLRRAGPRDTIVVFLAGHGVNDGADYLFLPTDARRKGKTWQARSVVDWRALQETLQSTRGRRIMLVDTCHSGNAFNARLVKDAADASIAVFAATDAETVAQERPALKHGVFTHAVLQGLKGAADLEPDRKVRVRELSRFVTETVKSLTKGAQEPTFHLGEDFTLSRL